MNTVHIHNNLKEHILFFFATFFVFRLFRLYTSLTVNLHVQTWKLGTFYFFFKENSFSSYLRESSRFTVQVQEQLSCHRCRTNSKNFLLFKIPAIPKRRKANVKFLKQLRSVRNRRYWAKEELKSVFHGQHWHCLQRGLLEPYSSGGSPIWLVKDPTGIRQKM